MQHQIHLTISFRRKKCRARTLQAIATATFWTIRNTFAANNLWFPSIQLPTADPNTITDILMRKPWMAANLKLSGLIKFIKMPKAKSHILSPQADNILERYICHGILLTEGIALMHPSFFACSCVCNFKYSVYLTFIVIMHQKKCELLKTRHYFAQSSHQGNIKV